MPIPFSTTFGTLPESNPELRAYILDGKGKKPNYRELARSLGVEKTIYDGDFRFQSRFTHSTSLSLGILKESSSDTLRIHPTYEPMLFMQCAELFIRNATFMLGCMEHYLKSISVDKFKAWNNNTKEVAERLSTWQKGIREKYGQSSGGDVS